MPIEPVKRLVVATDFSDTAERALTVGIRLATLMRATVDLVHVDSVPSKRTITPMPGVVPPRSPGPDERQGIEWQLAALRSKVRELGPDCIATTLVGVPADEINAYAHRIGAELIVVGTHGRTGIRRALLGSVAELTLRGARCPVVVVPSPGAG